MTHGMYASMHHVQAAAFETMGDGTRADTELEQLDPGDHAVLALGDCRNCGVHATHRLSESGPLSSHGGEWLWSGVVPIVPRASGLIWVLGRVAGDVMVDGSIRGDRLRPLSLWWTPARGRESRKLREQAGRLCFI
jgi:hypothetical protein